MSLLAVAVIAGLLIVLAVAFVLVLTSRLDRQADDELRVRAQAASTTVTVSDGRLSAARESATDSELDSSIWIFAGTRAVRRPHQPPTVQRAAARLAATRTGYADLAGRRFYVLPLHSMGSQVGTVVAALDTDPFDRTRDTIIIATAAVMGLLLLATYPVLRIATGRALRPVARMSTQAAEWSLISPDERFGRQDYRELNSLAGNLDEVLDRLAAVLRHERHLSAELSHELRTPLTRVTAQVDLLKAAARHDQIPELDAISSNCAAMDDIMDTLLVAARTDLSTAVGRCELTPVFTDLAQHIQSPTVHITLDDRLAVGVDRVLVVRMLSPILDNACRYAETTITLGAERTADGVVIAISNDGPPLDAAIAERIFDPGFQADSGPSHTAGAGLGLALARRLAHAADGEVCLDNTSRETRFLVTLPG